MPGPLLFAVPAVGLISEFAPRLAAAAISRSSEVNDGASIANRTVAGNLRGEQMIEEMKRNATAVQQLKRMKY